MAHEIQFTNASEVGMKPKEKSESVLGYTIKPNQTFTILSEIIEKNIEYIDKTNVVFVTGSNLVCYDLDKKTSKFLIRKCPHNQLTSMSVGYKANKKGESTDTEPFVCLGEYNPTTKSCQISAISFKNPSVQYILNWKSDKTPGEDWRICHSKILNNSPYCVAIAKREMHWKIHSKVSFWKFTQEKFISDVVIEENINSCSYNPQNALELILCGRGYCRLWNVFINEGSLKEHPQRFLRGKQEKEHNFLNAQFFENKAFMFIVGTSENIFYVIEGFQIIYDFNAGYEIENIHDLNINKVLQVHHEEEDAADKMFTETKCKDENATESEGTTDIISKKTYMNTIKDTKVNYDRNALKSFFLINDSLILIGFEKSSMFYIYKLDKDFKNKKERELALSKDAEESKGANDHQRVIRIAKNVKSIINIIANADRSQVIFTLEVYNDDKSVHSNSSKLNTETKYKHTHSLTGANLATSETSICLYLFNRSGSKLNFAGEVFKEYFYFNSIKSLDINEKKKLIYTLTNNNHLRCFDYSTGSFYIKHNFGSFEKANSITTCCHNNLFGICFERKFVLYALFKDSLKIFCEFEVVSPYAIFSSKGDYIAVAGESRVNTNSYCIYFIDAFHFNTLHVIENLPKIQKLRFMDSDSLLYALTENSMILGWNVRLDLMTVTLMNRLKEFDKPVESYYFRLSLKHSVKGGDYADFDYDSKNDLLAVIYTSLERVSVYSRSGKSLVCHLEMNKRPTLIRIVRELKCILVGLEEGSLQIYKWPLDTSEIHNNSLSVGDSKNLLHEINLHTRELDNLLLSDSFKIILTSGRDGSLILSNLLLLKDNRISEFSHFTEKALKMKPVFEDLIKINDLVEYRLADIRMKDRRVDYLDDSIRNVKQSNFEQKDTKVSEHRMEIANLEFQKSDALGEEDKKEVQLTTELTNLEFNIKNELQNRHNEHEKEKGRLDLKYKGKLQLYQNEIERLHQELKELVKEVEEKFRGISHSQHEFFKHMSEFYHKLYQEMKTKIEEALHKLVTSSAENDEAIWTITEHYKEMLRDIGKRIEDSEQRNKADMNSLEKLHDLEKTKEMEYQNNLVQKVQESDKIIQKNAEVKKSIIDTTQRTITFQEQLLETDKNLKKIAQKIKDLDTKNKHLEQIRFVLEHRMTSLDKEKAPLEGQCIFLEKQKNNLQEEFNKLILQINLKNQGLENKQSQLKASLIQNFEINDQILYVQKKLKHLHNEIKGFILTYQNEENEGMSLKENKASFIALKLKQFYDKYFTNSIDHEIQNYQFFVTKLQEETEKLNIANNFSLIMRDKGEEKLISEKEKFEQIKVHKERGFKRMQNENTVLIAECNRLRKNLHEVYMHVVDIESKFENLTKINPALNKTEIVYQIKEFIKHTHNKIKSNIKDDDEMYSANSSRASQGRELADEDYHYMRTGIIKSSSEQDNDYERAENKSRDNSLVEDADKNAYENFLKLPEIKSRVDSNKASFVSNSHSVQTSTKNLPNIIEDYKNNLTK